MDMSRTPLAIPAPNGHGSRQMRIVATGLLVLMAGVYFLARAMEPAAPGWGFARAFAEAAMVGGLADWFAVTALFRHPLGLKIPHTAIIPERKEALGRSLGQFVQTNFTSRDVLAERLGGAQVARRVGDWLAKPPNAARTAQSAADVLRGALEVADDAQIEDTLERLVERRIRATPAAPIVGRAIELAVEGGHHRALLDS